MGHLFLILAMLSGNSAFGSSCCGNSMSGFPVIFNKQRVLLSFSLSHAEALGRVEGSGYTLWQKKSRTIDSSTLQLAWSLNERMQLSAGAPILTGSYRDAHGAQTATHAGDTLITFNYEALPEYKYSRWKPIVYTSLIAVLPTGRSVFQSTKNEMIDVTGIGQPGLGFGLTGKKVWFPTTLLLQARALSFYPEKFGTIHAQAFWESTLSVDLSYATNWQGLVLSTGFTQQQIAGRGATDSRGNRRLNSQNTESLVPRFGLQRVIKDFTLALTVADQSLETISKNVVINRSAALGLSWFVD